MVCISCIVIPFILWFFHKYVQPLIMKFWRPSVTAGKTKTTTDGQLMPPPPMIMKFWRPSVTAAKTADGPLMPPPGKADSEHYLYIHDTITMHPVVVFAKTTCNFCNMAKDVLNDIGVCYDLENIDHRDNLGALQDMFESLTGARTVPRVFIGGKCVGGGSDVWSLHNKGELMPMLKAAGADFKKEK